MYRVVSDCCSVFIARYVCIGCIQWCLRVHTRPRPWARSRTTCVARSSCVVSRLIWITLWTITEIVVRLRLDGHQIQYANRNGFLVFTDIFRKAEESNERTEIKSISQMNQNDYWNKWNFDKAGMCGPRGGFYLYFNESLTIHIHWTTPSWQIHGQYKQYSGILTVTVCDIPSRSWLLLWILSYLLFVSIVIIIPRAQYEHLFSFPNINVGIFK